MKQTAVEWLKDELWKQFNFSFSDNIFEQAKEMEKQQKKEEYLRGYKEGIDSASTYHSD